MTKQELIEKWLKKNGRYFALHKEEFESDVNSIEDEKKPPLITDNKPIYPLVCDSCGCHPNTIYQTDKGTFCRRCAGFL